MSRLCDTYLHYQTEMGVNLFHSTNCMSPGHESTKISGSLYLDSNELIQWNIWDHYSDVLMGAVASQINSLTIVYSTVYSGSDQLKHRSFASLAFVRGIHRWPVNSPHKGSVTQKMFSCFHLMTSSWYGMTELSSHCKITLIALLFQSTSDAKSNQNDFTFQHRRWSSRGEIWRNTRIVSGWQFQLININTVCEL